MFPYKDKLKFQFRTFKITENNFGIEENSKTTHLNKWMSSI